MGKIAQKSTNYRIKRVRNNSVTDVKYLILILLSSIVVGAITGWFFMTIKPVKKYSTTLPNSQNRNEDSLLKSSFNSPPVNSPTPVQLTTPPISNRFSGSPLPDNTLAPKNVNLINELEKLQGTIEKLKNIRQIQDPEQGLELTTKLINDLRESEK